MVLWAYDRVPGGVVSDGPGRFYGIVRYIQTELQEPQIAGRLYGLLKEQISRLSYSPERNAVVDTPNIREPGLRRLLVKNYCVFYVVDNEQRVVRVARARDIASELADTNWND